MKKYLIELFYTKQQLIVNELKLSKCNNFYYDICGFKYKCTILKEIE